MSKPNKLAGALAGLKPKNETINETMARPAIAKSKDPAYQSTTIYLKKKTHAKAKAALLTANAEVETSDDKTDLSDLIEQLLTGWLEGRGKL